MTRIRRGIEPRKGQVFHVGDSLQSNRILIFGICMPIDNVDFKFRSNETLEVIAIDAKTPLTFPHHEGARDRFFDTAN